MFLSLLAFAAQATATPPVAVASQQPNQTKPKLICEYEEEIGSRLKGKRVCRSREEWERIRQDSRAGLELRQRNQSPQ